MSKSFWKYLALAGLVVAVDQAVKLLVHYNMPMGEQGEIKVLGDFFKLHYTLNPGMAFGVELGSDYGKLILTTFRLIALGLIGWWLNSLTKQHVSQGLLICLSLVLGGAAGNIVDSIFYGVWLNNAPFGVVSPWFHGQVIDMFYLDIWKGYLPDWVPVLGGEWYSLWPIFNVADACIFCGILTIMAFQGTFFPMPAKPSSDPQPDHGATVGQPEAGQ